MSGLGPGTADILKKGRALLEERPFHPHPLLWNGHLQTIIASQQRRSFAWGWRKAEEGSLELSDGCRIRFKRIQLDARRPTLIVIHGMAGSTRSQYMLALSHKAYREEWNSILFDLYDVGPASSQPRIFHAGSSGRVGELIARSLEELSRGPLLLTGVSMGGNILLKLLGEWGTQAPARIAAACAISPLVDLTQSWQMLDLKWENRLYRLHYLKRLKSITLGMADRCGNVIDLSRLRRLRTIKDFDRFVTVPLGGFAGVEDYYRRASAIGCLSRIQVPTLILHSKDDPLLPWKPLTRKEVEENSNLLLHLTDTGGHVGFIEGRLRDRDRSWAENRAIDFLRLAG